MAHASGFLRNRYFGSLDHAQHYPFYRVPFALLMPGSW